MKQLFLFFATLSLLAACGSDPERERQKNVQPSAAPLEDERVIERVEPVAPARPKEKETISHDAKPNPAVEGKLLELIYNLPEIVKMDKSIRKKTDGKRGLKTYISNRPSDDAEYYTVSVAEDNGSSLATYYTFRVYPDQTIMVYDVAEDRELTLKEWKKTL